MSSSRVSVNAGRNVVLDGGMSIVTNSPAVDYDFTLNTNGSLNINGAKFDISS